MADVQHRLVPRWGVLLLAALPACGAQDDGSLGEDMVTPNFLSSASATTTTPPTTGNGTQTQTTTSQTAMNGVGIGTPTPAPAPVGQGTQPADQQTTDTTVQPGVGTGTAGQTTDNTTTQMDPTGMDAAGGAGTMLPNGQDTAAGGSMDTATAGAAPVQDPTTMQPQPPMNMFPGFPGSGGTANSGEPDLTASPTNDASCPAEIPPTETACDSMASCMYGASTCTCSTTWTCDSNQPEGMTPPDTTMEPDPTPTADDLWTAADAALQATCAGVACHDPGMVGRFSLSNAQNMKSQIQRQVSSGRMPPAGTQITAEQKQAILDWANSP